MEAKMNYPIMVSQMKRTADNFSEYAELMRKEGMFKYAEILYAIIIELEQMAQDFGREERKTHQSN